MENEHITLLIVEGIIAGSVVLFQVLITFLIRSMNSNLKEVKEWNKSIEERLQNTVRREDCKGMHDRLNASITNGLTSRVNDTCERLAVVEARLEEHMNTSGPVFTRILELLERQKGD